MTTSHCYILNIYAVGLVVSEKKMFKVFPYKSMETLDPCGAASLDPSGMVGRIYVGNH